MSDTSSNPAGLHRGKPGVDFAPRSNALFHLGAMLKKNALQKWRAKASLFAEVFLPFFFVLGLVLVWNFTTETTVPATQYVDENTTVSNGALGIFTDLFCVTSNVSIVSAAGTNFTIGNTTVDLGVNITDVLDNILQDAASTIQNASGTTVAGLNICPSTTNASTCFGNAAVAGVAFCTVDDIGGLVGSLASPRPWGVPSLDVMYMMQQLARTSAIPALATQINFFRALRNSGFLYFAPDTPDTRALVDHLNATTATFATFFGGIIPTTSAATDRLKDDAAADQAWGVVEVRALNRAAGSDVTIHMRRNGIPLTNSLVDRFEQGIGDYNSRVYLMSGFLSIQNAVANYYLTEVLGGPDPKTPPPPGTVTVAPMPFEEYLNSDFLNVVGVLAPLAMVFGYLYTVSQLTKRLVEEKESRTREAMMIMGLDTPSFYLSWILTYSVLTFITALLIALVCRMTILPSASVVLTFLFFFLFGLSNVMLSIVLSAFFSKSRVAALVAPVVFFVLAVPSFALPATIDPAVLLGLSVLSPTAFSVGAGLFFGYERTTGMTWSNIASSDDAISLLVVLIFLVADTVGYLLLALYLDAVIPQDWGTPRHPLFFITEPVAFLRRRCAGPQADADNDGREWTQGGLLGLFKGPADDRAAWMYNAEGVADGRNPHGEFEDRRGRLAHEAETPLLPGATGEQATPLLDTDAQRSAFTAGSAGPAAAAVEEDEPTVRIKALRKEFDVSGGRMTAVDNLTFDLHEGEVTVLLGHNGAGKTTAINCMTGMIKPTSGDCTVYGKSVRADMQAARAEIGVCPQHNILWEGLTCKEHLEFFASLKGVPASERDAAVREMLDAVDLAEKAEDYAGNLSGGQKRKLSVAIAFIGGSRMVFLDEPTAGMDVAARRFTWDLIKRMTPGRTIVLTTHFMDEADLLGNTIAIMAAGRLECAGSSLFLKSRLGVGYTLTLSVAPRADRDAIIAEVRRAVPDATVLTNSGAELALRLPMASVPQFPQLLRVFESDSARLGVRSHGISVTTLEEIFLRIGEILEEQKLKKTAADKPAPALVHPDDQAQAHQDRTVVEVQPQPQLMALPRMESDTAHRHAHPSSPTVATIEMLPVDASVAAPADAAPQPAPTAVVVDAEVGGASEGGTPVWNRATPAPSLTQQFVATFVKRFHNAKRDRRTQVLQVILPVLGIILAMCLTLINFTPAPRMTMEPAQYKNDVIESYMANCPQGFAANVQQVNYVAELPEGSTPFNVSSELLRTVSAHGRDRLTSIVCGNGTTVDIARIVNGSLLNSTAVSDALAGFLFTNDTRYRHAAPLALNSWHNALARTTYAPAGVNARVVISNHPLPLTEDDSILVDSIRTFFIGIFIMIPFTFIPSTFVAWVVKERECKARHIQDVSGMNYVVYWTANLVFDSLSFMLTTGLAVAVFLAFQRQEYIGSWSRAAAIIALFMLYGVAGVTGSYVLSFLFSSHSTAQNVTMMANFICGFLLVLAAYIMSELDDTRALGETITWIFRCVPAFSLGNGIINMATTHALGSINNGVDSPWGFDVNGWNYVYMAIEGPVFFAITLIIDHPSLRGTVFSAIRSAFRCVFHITAVDRDEAGEEDEEDVAAERRRVERLLGLGSPNSPHHSDRDEPSSVARLQEDAAQQERAHPAAFAKRAAGDSLHGDDDHHDDDHPQDDLVVVRGLRKEYDFGAKVAVKDLTFGVHRGEVFGFLGTNGAGKTTTMSILCGEQLPTRGRGAIVGHDVVRDAAAARHALGYCPQFDALLELLTAEEHLYLYGRLRGLRGAELDQVVEALIAHCGLQPHRTKEARSLSGGNKRKLSVAIALVGGPEVLFLDEPSAGMDPGARRSLWDVIDAVAQHCSVVLTTHHLEEVEALSSRVAIMDRGVMKCIGSLQHLKHKFGSGFEMALRVKAERHLEAVQAFVAEALPQAELQEARGQKLTFALPQTTLLSKVFEVVEARKEELRITDYSVAQTSLESVFLKVAEHGDEETS